MEVFCASGASVEVLMMGADVANIFRGHDWFPDF